MTRHARYLAVSCLLASALAMSGEVSVTKSGKKLSLASQTARWTLNLSAGACPSEAILGDDEQSLLTGRVAMSMYYPNEKRWQSDAYWPNAHTKTIRRGDGTTVQVDISKYPRWEVRKTYTLRAGSLVLQVRYQIRAREACRVYPLVPIYLQGAANMTSLVSAGGVVPGGDLKISGYALKLNEPKWYGFMDPETKRGIAVAPVQWPRYYKRHWIGRHEDGSLHLQARLFPDPFQPGDEVTWAYNLVPFEGDAAAAAQEAMQAGPGPIEDMPSGSPTIAGTPRLDRAARGVRCLHGPRISEGPVIDGRLDDMPWRKAGIANGFVHTHGKKLPEAEVAAYVAYDDRALYVAARCHEPLMGNLVANSKTRGPNVWQDDCVELFLDTNRDRETKAHFVVNCIGVQQDNLLGERGVAGVGWTAATHHEAAAWTVEMAIPWSDLEVPPPKRGEVWGFNFNRSRRTQAAYVDWSATFGNFHRAERYGDLIFGRQEVELAHVDCGLDGGKAFAVVLRNRADSARNVTATLRVSCEGEAETAATGSLRLSGKAEGTLRLPIDATAPGDYVLALRLSADGQHFYRGVFRGTAYSSGLNSTIWPAIEQSRTLYVARGTTQHFFFFAANHSKRKYDEFRFVMLMPAGLRFVDATGDLNQYYFRALRIEETSVERDGRKLTKVVVVAHRPLGPRRIGKLRFFNSLCAAVEATDAIADGRHRMYYYLEAPNEREKEHTLDVVVLPSPEGRQPKQITVGISGWTISPSLPFWEGLMDTYQRIGVNMVEAHVLEKSAEMLSKTKSVGIAPWLGMWWFWWNDDYLKAHPEHAAVTFAGEPDQRRICPEIIADPDRDAITKPMTRYSEAARRIGMAGYWWDLEGPPTFQVCFCKRCLTAFQQRHRIGSGEDLTSLRLQTKYADEWTDFACDQTARVCQRIQLHMKRRGVHPKLAVYSGVQNPNTMRKYRVDWRKLVPHIDIATPSFYSFSSSGLNDSFTGGLRDMVTLVKSIRDIPVLATLTTGYEGKSLVRDPRLTKMQIVKSVAHGADGVNFWWWGTNDGRHYRAMAEATATIAALEPFFVHGTNDDRLVSISPTAGTSHAGWQHGRRVLTMVFNHSPEKPLAIGVAPRQLPQPGAWRVIEASSAPKRAVWTREGLTVSVAALGFEWWVLGRE